jgi:hypothetical protein
VLEAGMTEEGIELKDIIRKMYTLIDNLQSHRGNIGGWYTPTSLPQPIFQPHPMPTHAIRLASHFLARIVFGE